MTIIAYALLLIACGALVLFVYGLIPDDFDDIDELDDLSDTDYVGD